MKELGKGYSMTDTYFIVEASHLFRAGELFSVQIYVVDVVNYIARTIFATEPRHSWVLFGSIKDQQAEKYKAAVERTGVEVIRMEALDSRLNNGAKFYKPSVYLHTILKTLPKGSNLVLVGFHNTRFEEILKRYQNDFSISMAAFTTRSKSGMEMKIPYQFAPLLKHNLSLDNHIEGIKGEFKRASQKADEGLDIVSNSQSEE